MTTSNYTSEPEIPYGYCHCGCGQKTNIAKITSHNIGHIKGEPLKYIRYHTNKNKQTWSRFWSKIAITADDNLCWEWQKGGFSSGYGAFKINGKQTPASRLAWIYPNYVIPDGLFVCHSCDNPKCCNPKHLFLGTHQDNMDDMVAKGRWNNGFTKKKL